MGWGSGGGREGPSVKGAKQSGSGIRIHSGAYAVCVFSLVREKTVMNSYLNRTLVLKFSRAQSRDDKLFCRNKKGTTSGFRAG